MAHPSDIALSRLKKVLSRDPMLRDILSDALPGMAATGPYSPDVDVIETSSAHVIVADLPGVPKETVKVRLEGARLVIEGIRPKLDLAGTVRNGERAYGSFRREFLLPPDVDAESVAARFEDGVLTVEVPRQGGSKEREVPIA